MKKKNYYLTLTLLFDNILEKQQRVVLGYVLLFKLYYVRKFFGTVILWNTIIM